MKTSKRGDAYGGRASGPFQIHRPYFDDATQHNPGLLSGGKTYEDCAGPGSTKYSEDVVRSYIGQYATESRSPTDEDFARIHNGGPNGYKNPATEKYWEMSRKSCHNVLWTRSYN